MSFLNVFAPIVRRLLHLLHLLSGFVSVLPRPVNILVVFCNLEVPIWLLTSSRMRFMLLPVSNIASTLFLLIVTETVLTFILIVWIILIIVLF